MQDLKNASKLLSVQDLARILGISDRTIYNRVRPGAKDPFPIRAKRVGKLIRFDIRDVEKYIEKL